MKILRNNKKLFLGIIIGLIISSVTVYAASGILFQSSQVSFDNTQANLTKSNGDPVETVEEAIEALARNSSGGGASTCSNSPFQLGDYVRMTPTESSFSVDTTITNGGSSTSINPSSLTLWRVININSDCTIEMVSEYVTSTTVYFAGKLGYQNYIYYLQELAKHFANTTYTLDPSDANTPDVAFRIVGYDGQTKQISDTTRIDDPDLGIYDGIWYRKTTPLNGEESLGGGDEGYTKDLALITKAGVSLVSRTSSSAEAKSYWLASRSFQWSGTSYWYFFARYFYISGAIEQCDFAHWNGSSVYEGNGNYALRPIITLKANVTYSSGTGTKADPYYLSAS